MKIQRALTPSTLLILAVLLLTPADIFSCGPFFTEAVFVSKNRPAPSLDDYLAGHLGVVQPTYYPVYLAIAYRVLSGKPIDSAEIAKANKYWGYDQIVDKTDDVAMREWYLARAAALGQEAPSDRALEDMPNSFRVYRHRDYFNSYMNCTPDAFRNAVLTVQDRAKHFGAVSATMKEWVQAQNAVFSNCEKNDAMPAGAPADADPLIKADRQYQIAAANFYREEFDDARKEFLQIARDHNSPWQTIAPYLAARTLIRQATLSAPEGKPADPKLLAQAQTELRAILADPSAKEIHPAARRTLGFVEFRLSPDERMHTLALQISGQQPTTDLGQDLIDYTRLLDRPNVPVDVSKPPQPPPKIKVADDLTDWILTADAHADNNARAHALERWKQTHSLPWLIAALVKTKASDTGVDALTAAAAEVPDNSPGHDSASFQRARLLMQTQKYNDARTLLDRELARVKGPSQTRNLYLGMRWQLAQNFDEYLKFAPQVPVAYDSGDGTYCYDDNCAAAQGWGAKSSDALFDLPVAAAFDLRTPLQLLAQATQNNALPPNLGQALLLATWSRAAILEDSAQAVALGKNLGQAIPSTARYMSDYAAAKDAGAREFAAVFTMLHFPGMRPYLNQGILRETALEKIDDYRDNWWCKDFESLFKVPNDENSYTYLSYTQQVGLPVNQAGSSALPAAAPAWPSFLSQSQRSAAETEWKQLSQIGGAPNFFGKVVIAWARSHPNDPRVPEALHLVVRSTRYGCGDDDTGQFSLDAFDLLHIRYPKSEWAKKTPLWFK
jgi:hypothetical protein